jgi:hypothetical protein
VIWPFEKNDGSDDTEVTKVPLTTLYRWYMYDMNVDTPNKHLDIFHITPVSEEGDEKEREDSDLRTDNVGPLIPFINLYANMNAQYVFEMQKDELLAMPGMSLSKLEAETGALKQFYRQISFAGLLTAFSSAIELGIVQLDGSMTGLDEE